MSENPAGSPAIELAALGLVAAGKTLLEDASLTVPRGEVVLLVGLSGSGKSLTMRLLLGLLDPEDPAVLVKGDASGALDDCRSIGQSHPLGRDPGGHLEVGGTQANRLPFNGRVLGQGRVAAAGTHGAEGLRELVFGTPVP